MLGSFQVALRLATLDRLSQQIGGSAIGDAPSDGGSGGHRRDLLCLPDLSGSKVLSMDDVVVVTLFTGLVVVPSPGIEYMGNKWGTR